MRRLVAIVALLGASSVMAPGCSGGNGKGRDGGGDASQATDADLGDGPTDAFVPPDESVSLARSLPGVVLWLEARLGISTSAGQPVMLWRDQSGHDNHATQSDARAAPILDLDDVGGLPAVKFQLASWLTLADSLSLRLGLEDFALMAVERCFHKSDDIVVIFRKSQPDLPYTGAQLYVAIEGGTYAFLDTSHSIVSLKDDCPGPPVLIGMRRVGNVLESRTNGVVVGTVSGVAAIDLDAAGEDAYLGAHGQVRGQFQFEGHLTALVLVKGTFSDEALASLERYLMDHYVTPGGGASP
jgi:hypothetical protein